MKTISNCAVCLLKIAQTASDAAGASEENRIKATEAALKILAKEDFSRIPPVIAMEILAAVHEVLGIDDPFFDIKKEHDEKALKIVESWAPKFLEGIEDPDEILEKSIRAALVGNGMDLATIPEGSDPENFSKWLSAPWSIFDFEDLKSSLDKAKTIFYLCDNAGEVAFDRVLLGELLARGKKVTASVKGGPALNDATMDDAVRVGLPDMEGPGGKLKVITTGIPVMGADLENCSDEWKHSFYKSDLVLAKGQANLECLHDCSRDVFFITLMKCTHVSKFYGVSKGSAILYKGGKTEKKAGENGI
jgi:damage-control phosphatase, subfamily I